MESYLLIPNAVIELFSTGTLDALLALINKILFF